MQAAPGLVLPEFVMAIYCVFFDGPASSSRLYGEGAQSWFQPRGAEPKLRSLHQTRARFEIEADMREDLHECRQRAASERVVAQASSLMRCMFVVA